MDQLPVPEHLKLRKQPKQQRTRDLLKKIMASTTFLVRNYGYQSLNTNAIAEHAGVDVKSLYEFFPNKESILYRIADEWLASLRKLSFEFQSSKYQHLEWREYFKLMHKRVLNQEGYVDNFILLQGLWETLPEFTKLDEFHQGFLIEMTLKDLERFNAKGTKEELHTLSLYMIIIEDGIGAVLNNLNESEAKKIWDLQIETLLFHLSKYLD